jgi:serpin B
MAKVLRLPQEKLHAAFGDLRRYWDVKGEESGYRLSVANRLRGQQVFHFLPGFLALTRDHYGAELAHLDFARRSDQARQRINAWVEEQTQGKIRDLIQPSVLDSMTRLVLTDAIYLGISQQRYVKFRGR